MDVVKEMINYKNLEEWRKDHIVTSQKPAGFGCGIGPEMYY